MRSSIPARIASAAAAAAVVFSLLAAAADAKVVVDPLSGKRFGVTEAGPASAASPARRARSQLASPLNTTCSSPCPLSYHSGGVVQHAEQIYLLFWDPGNALSSSYKSGLATWVNDLAAADYTAGNPISVTQQYYDASGAGGSHSYVPYAVQNAGSLSDTDSYPASGCTVSGYSICLTDSQIEHEVASYASAHGKPTGLGVEYFVFTPSGVDSCFDSGATECAYSSYCGYHSDYQPSPGTDVLYADMPYVLSGHGCGSPPALNPGGIDAVAGVFSHELSETMTDPRLDAWYDGNGNEIGDKCAYHYGTLSTTLGGLSYNVALGSDYYYIQQEWDNRTDACLTTDTDAQPTATLSIPSPVAPNAAASFSLTNVTPAGRIAYVNWTFGDGTSTSTSGVSTVQHTYSGAGSDTVTAIITDDDGNELKLSGTVNVTDVPVYQTKPTISGVPVPGQTLTETHGTWTGSPTSYGYQWQDCDSSGNSCSDISGATGQTYQLVSGDLGHTIRVKETAHNTRGDGNPASSAATAVVVSAVPAATTTPTITGTAQQGQTLIELHGGWTNYPTSYAIKWEDCDASGSGCTAIAGVTSTTYLLSSSDVGHTIEVQETATNALGSASALSAPTSVVVALPASPTPSAGGGGGGGSGGGSGGGGGGSGGSPTPSPVVLPPPPANTSISNPGGTSTPAGPGGTPAGQPSPAQVKASLVALSAARPSVRLSHLLKTATSTYFFTAPSAGRVTIVIKLGGVPVAVGSRNFGSAQNAGIVVRLTPQARKLIKRLTKTAKLQLVFTFTPAGGSQTTVRQTLKAPVGR